MLRQFNLRRTAVTLQTEFIFGSLVAEQRETAWRRDRFSVFRRRVHRAVPALRQSVTLRPRIESENSVASP